ncbi:MAG: SAP domain-containing protein [Bacteroidota bacterium]
MTIPGGRYLDKHGTPRDAHGNVLDATAEASPAEDATDGKDNPPPEDTASGTAPPERYGESDPVPPYSGPTAQLENLNRTELRKLAKRAGLTQGGSAADLRKRLAAYRMTL